MSIFIFKCYTCITYLIDHTMSIFAAVVWLSVVSCALVGSQETSEKPNLTTNENVTREAACLLQDNVDYNGNLMFSGTIKLTQTSGAALTIEGNITGQATVGANSKVERGFHVHRFGHIFESCNFSGSDFNPFNTKHGSITSQNRHVGDYGNIELMTKGTVSIKVTDNLSSLFGDNSILGRSLVIHEFEDDLGVKNTEESRTEGTSGRIVSCCVIALRDETKN
ncbi:superoxide dismutase [Cu-Zn]-like [Biomphalaria glabrata]|uniref:Superoxide dismutase [Cu-Zn]-like n=1 Tax=Biomphalaria glabrata TaxID=6526 RepID=A0A9U8DUS5_BIOGL|nr:superoxide dismutase [Cu-Zn]-like [Biomphalaria glabrata]